MKEAQAIATLHRIGEDIIALADYLAAYYAEQPTAPTEKPTAPTEEPAASPTEEPAGPAEQSVVTAEEPSTPTIKLEDVRTVLADISRKGKTAEMKALLGKFGAAKLSEVRPEDYAALLAAAQEAQNA